MNFTVEYEVCTPPALPERSGSYDLVRETRPLIAGAKSDSQIWFNPATGDVVTVEKADGKRPFQVGFLDFDGLLVDTEFFGGFFDARRFLLMREAEVSGSDNDLAALMARVYRWEGTFPLSVVSMVDRIQRRQSLDGHSLDESASEALGKLLYSKTLERWADLNGQDVDNPYDSAPEIIARALDRVGVEMLNRDPNMVLDVAPIMPGAEELVRAFPHDMPLCIASGSGRETIIEPILRAHAALRQPLFWNRFTSAPGYIVGEEDMGETAKPERDFYERVAWRLAHLLHHDGLIPPGGISLGDAVFIGNPIGGRRLASGDAEPDMSMPRRNGMRFVSVGGGAHEEDEYGPLTASVADMPSLLRLTESSQYCTNTTLKRLAHTLHF